jgi:predicted RNA-binding protein YlxR (DUF448 family)
LLSRACEDAERHRRCIATGVSGDPDMLLRFVRDPHGVVVPDLAAKLPGRGAWVTASRDALETASRKGLFSRAFRCAASCPEDLVMRVETGLESRLISALGLARRAGTVVIGFEKTREALATRRARLLIMAADSSPDVGARLERLGLDLPVLRNLTGDVLSGALGYAGATYAAVTSDADTGRILREAKRLVGLRVRPSGAVAPVEASR